jgi:hypothetical protein
MSLLHQQRAEACNCNLATLSTAWILYQLLRYFINCLDTSSTAWILYQLLGYFINCLDTLAGQLVTSERRVCGDSWHSIITTSCHILHSVSHWPMLVYFVNCNYSARSPCQLQRHSARVTQVCQGSIHVSHWLVLDLPINGLPDTHTSLAFTYASGLRILPVRLWELILSTSTSCLYRQPPWLISSTSTSCLYRQPPWLAVRRLCRLTGMVAADLSDSDDKRYAPACHQKTT